jgi:anti-anti-sigma factor
MLGAISSPAAMDPIPTAHSEPVTITLSGDYDFSSKGLLAALLSPAETAKRAIIDLTKANYIDCSCLEIFILLRKKMLLLNGYADIRLVGVSRHMKKIFTLCGLETLFSLVT